MRDVDHTGTLGLQEFQKLWDDLQNWKVTKPVFGADVFVFIAFFAKKITQLKCYTVHQTFLIMIRFVACYIQVPEQFKCFIFNKLWK